MRRIRLRDTLGFRLSTFVAIAVLGAVLAVTGYFALHEFRQSVEAERVRLAGAAAAFASAASNPLANGDRRAVLEVLRGIRDVPDAVFAAVETPDGGTFAAIGGGAVLLPGADRPADDWVAILRTGTLAASAPIRRGGEMIGRMTLSADISWLRARYTESVSFAALFGLAIIVVTVIATRRMITGMLEPLMTLTTALSRFGGAGSLTMQPDRKENDEVKILVEAFNAMVGRIRERDEQIMRHQASLEETVRQRTAELRLAKDEAEAANAAKSDFLAVMSHEIRTPMNGMMVMAEMLAQAPLQDEHRRYAETITRSGKGLLNIINEVLDLSKIEAGRLELEDIGFSLDEIVADAVALFGEKARQKGLSIAARVDTAVALRHRGDPSRIAQVVGNLVGNALKFTEAGGVELHVAAQPAVDGRQAVTLHVRDTGIGIARQKHADVFERFKQADQSITRRFGGTGLGLSICKQLVETMGGSIGVESAPGKGSDFHFHLDLSVDMAAPDASPLDGRRIAIAIGDTFAGRTVVAQLLDFGAGLADITTERPDVVLASADRADIAAASAPTSPLIVLGGGKLPGIEHAGRFGLPVSREELIRLGHFLATGDAAALSGQVAAVRAGLPDFDGLMALVVDDVAVNRQVLCEALSSLKVVADVASSGERAIHMSESREYGVIFMDCSMPGMDGFEATSRIRRIEAAQGRKPTRIVALTAHAFGRDSLRWREAGMDDYVAKPFALTEIAAACAAATGRHTDILTVAAEARRQPSAEDFGNEPILAPETLAMFATIAGASGKAMASRIFSLFAAHAPRGFADLRESVEARDPDVASVAHALKSMCSSAGARRAAVMCQAVEDRSRAGRPIEPALLGALEDTITETLTEMDGWAAPNADDDAASTSSVLASAR